MKFELLERFRNNSNTTLLDYHYFVEFQTWTESFQELPIWRLDRIFSEDDIRMNDYK